ANAYYNLALSLRDKGDLTSLQNGLAVAQQAMAILQKNTKNPDYKVASDLADNIKKTIATGIKQAQEQQTANQAANPLQNAGIQNANISSLQKATSVTPAPAVTANPNARIPVTSVSPVPSPKQ